MRQRRLVWLGLAAALCAPAAGWAQERPARPREVRGLDFRPDGVWRKQARAVRAMRARLLAQRRFGELNAPLAAGAAVNGAALSGTLVVPAVLFTFQGTAPPAFPPADYDALLFGVAPSAGQPYTYRSYYREMSNDLLDIQGATYGWATLSQPEATYNGGTSTTCQQENPFGTANCNGIWSNAAFDAMQGGLLEALASIDAQIDFRQYSYDPATGVVSLVLFMHPTRGGECGPGDATNNHLWAHRSSLFYRTNDPWPETPGQFLQVRDYIFQSGLGGSDSCTDTAIMPIGTVAHETGHGFGLPDLYDTGGQTEGVGRWSLMAAGNFDSPSSPARMDAWSLNELGWVTVAPLTAPAAYTFGAAPTSDTAFLIRPTGSNPRGEYFLLENRQAVGADTALIRRACQVWHQAQAPPPCSGGLLVWHVDSQQVVNGSPANAMNSGPIHGLALLQADGRGNLDSNVPCTPPGQGCADRGDAGDPFPGMTGNMTLAFSTTPSSVLNAGACAGFRIETISQVVPNGEMRFDLTFGAEPLVITTTSPLPDGQWGFFYFRVLSAACGSGSHTWAVDSGAPPPGIDVTTTTGALSGAPADTGTYTFRVSATDGPQTSRRTLTLRVAEPSLALPQVLNVAFQGPAATTDDQRRYLDAQGNANGTFDIGDVLRWLERTGNVAAAGGRVPAPGGRP